jgi:hypothetical protein
MILPPAGQISYVSPQGGGDVNAAIDALNGGRFNDPTKAISLPGTDAPPDPITTALTTGDGTAANDGEQSNQDSTNSTDSTDSTDSQSATSGDQQSSGTDQTTADSAGGGGTSEPSSASEQAASGGTGATGEGQ